MAEVIFWTAVACIAYVYFGYPLLLTIWRKCKPRPIDKRPQEPSVSVLIAMHNERENAERKIRNCLELDYPADKLQVIVSLDGPTDGTEDVVGRYLGERINAVYSPRHQGKAVALNHGVAAATGEIVLFTDARQRLEKSAVRELVANFADPCVGAVSGELILVDEQDREATDAVGVYWRYEKRLRAMESEVHSVVGATGGIYAIRRGLFRPLPPGAILDDVAIPMRIVLAGRRVVFDPAARAYDLVSESPETEYGRKARTLTGNYQLLAEMPELLAPWRNPLFVQLVSHKLGRLLVPYFLVALFVSNLFLLEGLYRIAFVGQVFWYMLALVGGLISARGQGRAEARLRPERPPYRGDLELGGTEGEL